MACVIGVSYFSRLTHNIHKQYNCMLFMFEAGFRKSCAWTVKKWWITNRQDNYFELQFSKRDGVWILWHSLFLYFCLTGIQGTDIIFQNVCAFWNKVNGFTHLVWIKPRISFYKEITVSLLMLEFSETKTKDMCTVTGYDDKVSL